MSLCKFDLPSILLLLSLTLPAIPRIPFFSVDLDLDLDLPQIRLPSLSLTLPTFSIGLSFLLDLDLPDLPQLPMLSFFLAVGFSIALSLPFFQIECPFD